MDDARLGLDEQAAGVVTDLGKLAVDLRELERTTAEARHELARLNKEKTHQEETRTAVATRLAAARAELAAGDRQQTDLLRRRASLAGRQDALAAERERLQGSLDDLRERVSGLQDDLGAATAACAEDDARLAALEERLQVLAGAVVKTGRVSAATRLELETLQERRGDAATRLQALRRLQESGAGLFSGVREVLSAGRDGRLNGVLGTVAELIIVPESFELAIESALGSHLQDIVVDAWQDAEAAIAHLKHSGSGRATFQPLDTIRGGNGRSVSEVLRQLNGVHGIAAELVSAPPPLTPVRTSLLGHTLIVDGLPTARAALAVLAPGWIVVTEAGDIARSGGSVTGGSPVRDSGTLGRERELRELPATIAALEESLGATRRLLAEAEVAASEAQREHQQATSDRATLLAAASERRHQRDRSSQWLDTIVAEQARGQERLGVLCSDLEGVQHEQEEVEDSLDRLQSARATLVRAHDEAETSLVTLTSATSELERAAGEEGRRLAGLEERLRAERRREASLRAQERALAEELTLRDERTSLLERERESTVAEQARLSNQIATTSDDHAAVVAELEPLRAEVAELANSAQRLATSLQTAQGAAIDRRRENDQAEFALERARQDLAVLLQRLRDDLDVDNAEELLEHESASMDIPQATREAEIARLRERLRRVGYVGDDAVAIYEREAAHQAFLREQLADVDGAAAALRELIADLRQTMRTRFDETFARVAAAFAESFAVLFGGGTARLILSNSDNGTEPGIEIVAQPPGKRPQNLALLSGGERALTAAALLFAILKVNPVPFCLLDEVDAALDEANVVRFREELQILAAQTQVIVVTHNRVTIEIADTLYGVSMGADGVSQVLSLRLSEALPAD
jgi:chromosome segregation protein